VRAERQSRILKAKTSQWRWKTHESGHQSLGLVSVVRKLVHPSTETDFAAQKTFGLKLLENGYDSPPRKFVVRSEVARSGEARPGLQTSVQNCLAKLFM
jgi:hypothetical protein